jgi:hypothetical protein
MITIEFLNDVVLEGADDSFQDNYNVEFLAMRGTAILTDDQTGKQVEVSGDLFLVGVDKKKLLDQVAENYLETPLRILRLETNRLERFVGTEQNNSPLPVTLTNAEVHALAKDDVRVSIPLGFSGEFLLEVEFEDADEDFGWFHGENEGIFIAAASDEMKTGFYDVSGVRMEDSRQTELALESRRLAKRNRLNEIAALSYDSELSTETPLVNFWEFDDGVDYGVDYGFDDQIINDVEGENYAAYGDACLEEHYMSRKHLRIIKDYACEILEMLEAGVELPEWIEAHITVAATYIRDAKHVLEHGDYAEKKETH